VVFLDKDLMAVLDLLDITEVVVGVVLAQLVEPSHLLRVEMVAMA
jgi:hypothetical protein